MSQLRELLSESSPDLYGIFLQFEADIAPRLRSIEHAFPEFTRHDPSHASKLEEIAGSILNPAVIETLTEVELFALLCSLWLHDAGMGIDQELRDQQEATAAFREHLTTFQRAGGSAQTAWLAWVRAKHHAFCPHLADTILPTVLPASLRRWIGLIAESHGAREIHDRSGWPRIVAVDNSRRLRPALLAIALRLADILHFNEQRAPEFMQEHRRIRNSLSILHWKAHQVSADYVIYADTCFIDGTTADDEAYWFAHQFIEAMDEETIYCKLQVVPTLGPELENSLTFSRVVSRISAVNFVAGDNPIVPRIDTSRFLRDLLGDALYAGKPAWLREVVQNAFDACRDAKALNSTLTPTVTVAVNSSARAISVRDLGVGMTRRTVEEYLLVAGSSYWDTPENRAGNGAASGHVGKFGIGFMSLFGVAESIEIVTKRAGNPAWRFRLRSPGQAVRLERSDQITDGTEVRIILRANEFARLDIPEEFDKICKYPEFPIELIVDGEVERSLSPGAPLCVPLSLGRHERTGIVGRATTHDIDRPGIKGGFILPKVRLNSLERFVPDMRGWLRRGGFEFDSSSGTTFGGISYPAIHSCDHTIGYTHLPSLGIMRIAVSPELYPLEMNLARDRFVCGPAVRSAQAVLAREMDRIMTAEIVAELHDVEEPLRRSAITAVHSHTMLGLWLGQVPPLSVSPQRRHVWQHDVRDDRWARLTTLASGELKFGCITPTGTHEWCTIDEFVARQATVFAVGTAGRGVPRALAEAIHAFDPHAFLLIGLPEVGFGILELRHWAAEEILVPVDAHHRTAYGLCFAGYEHPFQYFPRELDHVSIAVASGPEGYAAMDYRDTMAEAKSMPSGSSSISAVLNRRSPKAATLIDRLAQIPDASALMVLCGRHWPQIRLGFDLGNEGRYDIEAPVRLAAALNRLSELLQLDGLLFEAHDFPAYFRGSEAIPFGRFVVSDYVQKAFAELAQLEQPLVTLS